MIECPRVNAAHDLDDPPQGRLPSGVAAPAPARGEERRGEDQRQQEQEVVGPLGDVAHAKAEHRGEPPEPTAPGAVDGDRGVGVAHRAQKHRLLARHAIAPVAGQRDHRRMGDQVVEDRIVAERQPVHGRPGGGVIVNITRTSGSFSWTGITSRTVTDQGRPSGADVRTCNRM